MPIFAVTIFTAAFLLFQVQPIIAKYILPWFGGSPAVWTTAMLFFQALLLGGYAYAHFSIRYFRPRGQAVLHLGLLVVGLALLPITPGARWKPEVVDAPTLQIMLLLLVTVGWPFFILASTSPLLQAWFSRLRPGASPYLAVRAVQHGLPACPRQLSFSRRAGGRPHRPNAAVVRGVRPLCRAQCCLRCVDLATVTDPRDALRQRGRP